MGGHIMKLYDYCKFRIGSIVLAVCFSILQYNRPVSMASHRTDIRKHDSPNMKQEWK
jgi:hypothetical protein